MAAALGASAMPVAASDYWLAGQWCEENGDERLFVEETGLGFNEHTICRWTDGAPAGRVVDTSISCANVYVSDGETVRMDEANHRFQVDQAADGSIALRIDGAAVFLPCEE